MKRVHSAKCAVLNVRSIVGTAGARAHVLNAQRIEHLALSTEHSALPEARP